LAKICEKRSTNEKKKIFFKHLQSKRKFAQKLSKIEELGEKQKYLGDGMVAAYYRVFKTFTAKQKEKFRKLREKINKFFIHQVLVKQKYKRSFCRCHKMVKFVRKYGETKTGVDVKNNSNSMTRTFIIG
jgi:hypothetical protein